MNSQWFGSIARAFAVAWMAIALESAGAASFDSEIAAFEAADAASPPPANAIPFVGSSSIKMWPNLAAAFPRHPVLNRGFGGSQMSDVLYYFDRVVARYQPPLVVVYEGDNDLAAGKTVAQVFADYSNFAWRVQQELPATDIAFLSVKPSPSRAHLLDEMVELNTLIAGMSDGRRIRYIDVYHPMLDWTGQPRPELFGADNLHMNAAGYALWNSIVGPALDAWASTAGGVFLFDFGAAATTTEHAAPPEDPANYWNNLTETIGATGDGVLSNIVTIANSQTSVRLEMLSRFNGANGNGTDSSPLFASDATRDSLFGNTEPFNGQSNLFPAFKLTGLDTQSVYHISFFASRTNAADNRETAYTISGGSSTSVVLNAANNVTGVVTANGIRASEAGEVTIALTPGANNNSANHFTYLGVLKMEAIPPQRPLSFLRQPENLKVPELQSAMFRAGIAGSPPYYIQWLSNGVAVPGANQLIYTIPSVTKSMSGSFFSVSISNLAYHVVSSNALLEVTEAVIPTEPASQVLLFDFGGTATTGRGPSPDDPSNHWNNVTTTVGSLSAGVMTNLITVESNGTSIGLAMVSRFNGANANGTTTSGLFPADATSDSLFGNTETFSGLSNIFPVFKLTGLNPVRLYRLTFYASRTGISDNRETIYTVAGAATNSAALNAANNVATSSSIEGAQPGSTGELRISLTPGPSNNNANHFTYLGVLRLELISQPRYLAPSLESGNIRLQWSGAGAVEWAPAVTGPWGRIAEATNGTHTEPVLNGANRFYRVRAR